MKKINLFQWPELTTGELRQLLAGRKIIQDGKGNFYLVKGGK